METQVMLKRLADILPAKVNYSEVSNSFLGNGYVSRANNTYYNAIRFADGIVIKEDVGEGYKHTFLNGLRIYSLKDKRLIADRSYHCMYYSPEVVLAEAKSMLIGILKDAARHIGATLNMSDVETAIERVLMEAFDTSQIDMVKKQARFLLNG